MKFKARYNNHAAHEAAFEITAREAAIDTYYARYGGRSGDGAPFGLTFLASNGEWTRPYTWGPNVHSSRRGDEWILASGTIVRDLYTIDDDGAVVPAPELQTLLKGRAIRWRSCSGNEVVFDLRFDRGLDVTYDGRRNGRPQILNEWISQGKEEKWLDDCRVVEYKTNAPHWGPWDTLRSRARGPRVEELRAVLGEAAAAKALAIVREGREGDEEAWASLLAAYENAQATEEK